MVWLFWWVNIKFINKIFFSIFKCVIDLIFGLSMIIGRVEIIVGG